MYSQYPTLYVLARAVYNDLPPDIQHELTLSPRDGTRVARACVWRCILRASSLPRVVQSRIMAAIIHGYITTHYRRERIPC